jgi:hypothetical protein
MSSVSVILGARQSDVAQGGSVVLSNMFETTRGSYQGAHVSNVTISVDASTLTTPGAGSGTPVPVTSTGITTTDGITFNYTWTAPWLMITGDYLVTWTGTLGAVTEVYQQTVTVSPNFNGAPAPGLYATAGQYRAWSGDQSTPDQVVVVAMQRAAEDIDNAVIGAVYPVNQNGLPTDPFVINAFARAACAQAQYLIADNDPAGMKRQYTSLNVGGISYTRARNMTTYAFPLLCPRAAQILHVAGVLPSAALINW